MANNTSYNGSRYGFIYPIVSALVQATLYISLVELFKAVGKRLAPTKEEEARYCSVAIDVFILFKWITLSALWLFGVQHPLAVLFVAYMIGTNLFVYFYHHVWRAPYDGSDENRRRRFVNLVQSFAYNLMAFAYLYDVPLVRHFEVSGGANHALASSLLSVSRSMLVDYSQMSPVGSLGIIVTLVQTATVVCFLSILLSVSVPSFHSQENNK